jgi:hypothetical protein
VEFQKLLSMPLTVFQFVDLLTLVGVSFGIFLKGHEVALFYHSSGRSHMNEKKPCACQSARKELVAPYLL